MIGAVSEAFCGAVFEVISGVSTTEKFGLSGWTVLVEFSRIGRVGEVGKNSLSSEKAPLEDKE